MKILAIDDNPDNLTALKAVMSDRLPKATLLTALNGPHGLEVAQAEDPDVILLDIVMPGMDGYAVCRKLKEDAHLQTIPVLFLTALKTDRHSRVKALDAGAEGFLAKPFDEIELTVQIQAMAKIKTATLMQRDDNARLAGLVAERTRLLQQSETATLNLLEDLKAENAARKQSEENYRTLFKKMLNGFALHEIICTPDGQPNDYRFLAVNPAFEQMTGLKAEAIMGRTVLEVLPHTERRWIETYGKVALTGEPAFFEDYSAELNKHFEVTAFRPAPHQFACMVADITERKRAEAELQKMQNLQSVGTLAGGIAHDFNNILMGVFGNISLAKDELAKDHPGYHSLEEAEKSMNRAVRLTKQLLTFAKGGDPVKEDVSLETLVQEVARFDLSGSPIKLVYQQAAGLWLAEVDKGQIQQVISNLTINARQAMPEGGSLHITLANADLSATTVPGLRPGKYVQITVRDEGTGIDPKYLERIFDPYFTTKQTGSGLGLATTYSIINKHGGHIRVESELGQGTTFTLYLPASRLPTQAETAPPDAAGPALDRPAKILVMDDEEAVRNIVERILNRSGFAVATAPGGHEALAMYRQAMADGAPFDVVIMDLTVPGGIGGKDAIKAFLAMDPQAKAIVSSGYADDPVMANYADYGFKDIAIKPYTPNELRTVLARVLK